MTKERFDRLYADDVLKKEYDQIIKEIDSRFSEVVLLLFPKICDKGWFTYGNYDYESKEDEGEFDPEAYKEYIEVGGQYSQLVCKDHPLNDGNGWVSIPTRYLWIPNEDIKKGVENHFLDLLKKEVEKVQKINLKQEKKYKIEQSIKSKLTQEELKQISFK